jgi:putative transcriptional regulator
MIDRNPLIRFLRLLAGLGALFIAAASPAADLGQPVLLVATPELRGPYGHTAMIAVPTGDNGHVGFIINRVTDKKMSELFPQHAPSEKVVDPVYFGGPEAADALFAVVPRDPGEAALHIFGDLYVTASARVVDRIIETTPNDARYFVGFVGWRPGELAAEIGKGWWHVGTPEASMVFQKDTSHMWEELLQRLGHRTAPLRPGERES